jgi:4-hydroxybutyrate CoA-transferase
MKDWEAHYRQIRVTPDEAVRRVRSGQRLFVETNCSEPLSLIEALVRAKDRLRQVEIVQGFYRDRTCPYAQPGMENHFSIKSLHASQAIAGALEQGWAEYIPVHLSDIPRLCTEGPLPVDVALIQLSPPDENGFCSFGITVNFIKPIAENAKIILAEINDQMPKTSGDTLIHISQLHAAVEHSHPLIELRQKARDPISEKIASYVADLIPNGATLQVGIGEIPDAVLHFLEGKKELGLHTGTLSDAMVELIRQGVVTNGLKTLNRGKSVTSMAMGTNSGVYRFVGQNPEVEFYPVSYTHDVCVIGRIDRFITVNSAIQVDLFGQVNAESIGGRVVSGVGGSQNFTIGASRSKGGKSIVALPSTAASGKVSRIVPRLDPDACATTPRADIHYVVTEYGVADLRWKSLSQRAKELAAIAHPDFRETLRRSSKGGEN